MSSKSAPNKKKIKKQSDWVFNLSAQFASSSESSGSESDNQEPAAGPGASRLPIDDFDLSTREEHVAYKPNPFSIAKINAAHRPTSTLTSSVLQPKTSLVKPVAQTRKLNKRSCLDSSQTTIMEGFKTQAMKKPGMNAVQSLQLATNPLSLNSNPIVNIPASEKSVASASPSKSTLSTTTFLSASAVLTSPRSISVSNASNFPPISSCAPEYAHILPLKASQHHDAQMFSKISQSRALAPARFLPRPDILHDQRKRTYDRRPVFPSFSSPGRSYDDKPLDHDSRILYSQPHSSPIQPIRQGPFRPYSKIPLRETALEPSSSIIDKSDHYEELPLDGDYVVRANENSSGFLRHSPTPPTSKPLHSLNQRQPAGAQPADLSPSPLPMPPPNPSKYLAGRRTPNDPSTSFRQAESYHKRDAYQYPIIDPDEEWSTLPSRKKKKLNIAAPKNYTHTKSFHIPGLRLPPTMKVETKTLPPTRRVKVYLPPPPTPVDVRDTRTNKDSGSGRTESRMKETEDGRRVASSSPPKFDASAYPSPSASKTKRSLSSLSSRVGKSRDCTPRSGVYYRPPSPPTSDPPIPSEEMDIRLEVDQEGIQARYPEVKRLSRKRRRLSAEIWKLLGIYSCGYVRKDVDGSRSGEEEEIQIVVWTGLQPFA